MWKKLAILALLAAHSAPALASMTMTGIGASGSGGGGGTNFILISPGSALLVTAGSKMLVF